MNPRILDLFCGAGGTAEGYRRAGFQVVGVDIADQPNYPFRFWQGDALGALDLLLNGELLDASPDGYWLEHFDAIHASPPCPRYSTVTPIHARGRHPDLIAETRRLLQATGLPYVIENVVNAPLVDPVRLCGSSFGLDVRRHRLFETNVPLTAPPCKHGWQTPRFQSLDGRQVAKGQLASVVGVHGNCNYAGEFELRCKAMGIDWMTNAELTQAIPPAYTTHVGSYLWSEVQRRASDAETA